MRKRPLDSGATETRASVNQILQFWKVDRDLACVRDPELLAKLAQDEQRTWRALCAEGDELASEAL